MNDNQYDCIPIMIDFQIQQNYYQQSFYDLSVIVLLNLPLVDCVLSILELDFQPFRKPVISVVL